MRPLRSNPFVKAAKDEIVHWPGVSVAFGERSKHCSATFTFQGASRFVIYSLTPATEWCAVRGFLGDVRATLRLLGAERAERPQRASRRRRIRHERPIAIRSDGIATRLARDPFTALAALFGSGA